MSSPEESVNEPEASATHEPEGSAPSVRAPDDVDPVDHAADTVVVDGEETSIPGEWL